MKKKLTALSKEKGCELLHVGSEKSVAKHVQNIHEHDGDLYDACPHGHLEGTARHKKWFKPGNKIYNITTFKAQFVNVSVLNEFVSNF